jgi:Flp pilus assembly protein TadG
MKPPLIYRDRVRARRRERGVTLALVAATMFAIIAMAALSIDVVSLYLAREEAQRTADAAALAAARVLSLTGVTGDPDNIQGSLPSAPWPVACNLASQVAQAVVNQNSVGQRVASTTTVTFVYNGTANDCTAPSGTAFALNPQVQVKVVRQNLQAFFSRIWGQTSNQVSATATAEVYNSSNSGSLSSGTIIPVNPRCVKPWIVPNMNPNGGSYMVQQRSGAINGSYEGIQYNGATPGIVGERYTFTNACGVGGTCPRGPLSPPPGTYVPALVSGTPVAIPSCANGDNFEQAVGGCDQSTVYACGTSGGSQADLSASYNTDTHDGAECLIRQPGQDTLDTTQYPYQILAGSSNPIAASGTSLTSSTSIVTLPIYDNSAGGGAITGPQPLVTIIGFLQVFINQAHRNGNLDVTILNVAGCGNGTNTTGTAVNGTSPVPIRLITP